MASVYEQRQARGEVEAVGQRPVSGPLLPPDPGRQRAQIFGEDPILYDRFRPGYPRELMETVVADTGDGPVLEIGAGTGKATRALLALGRSVVALEPDDRMAALLERNCPSGVTVVPATLETAELPAEAFDLAVAAQTWHWVDPDTAYSRVAAALAPRGRLALLWHHPEPTQGLLGEAMAQLYAQLVPEVSRIWPGLEASAFNPPRDHPEAAGRFWGWSRHEHRWHRHLDGLGLVGWLCSSSAHRLLGVAQRTDLMTAVAALVDELGGEVVVKMRTVAHLGYRL